MENKIYFNPDPKSMPKKKKLYAGIKKKFPKSTGEKELFLQIWRERPHISAINGEPLGDEPNTYNFMHVLSKKAYPDFRLKNENIVLATFDQHYYYDSGGTPHPEDIEGWKKIAALQEKLKIEYYLPQPAI